MENNREYYIGLDIGTDSVGYAVTDERYQLIKYKNEPMWGSHLFDPANQCAERRGFRTARRRLDRRQQRVQLVDEIFAPEVAKVDKNYYIRKKESALYGGDETVHNESYLFFNGLDYNEKDYYRDYPTIHHLICDLMQTTDKKFDIRLINIAVDWLVAHRGHFLSDIGMANVDKVLDFHAKYEDFISYFDIKGIEHPWDRTEPDALGEIFKKKIGISKKKAELTNLLFGGKIVSDDGYFLDKKELVSFLAGGKVKCSKLFPDSGYEEDLSISISDDMETVLPQLGDDAELIAKMTAMYDWSILSDILDGSTYISESKVKQYEQHKKDLKNLKAFVRKYAPDKYYEIFRKSAKELCNYTAYSYNVKSVNKKEEFPKKKADKKDFYDYLRKTLQLDKLVCDEEDQAFYEDMMERMSQDHASFLPKQVDTDNRVIPYQLYMVELEIILENAGKHYPFLLHVDEDGYSNIEKLKSIFKFKIPYYVGPLRTDNTSYGWMKRKAERVGKIYPWNFDDMVDLDASEKAFINKMTNTCTYIPGENVLPKWSVLYTKYMVLNEINNIKVNDSPISVTAKQGIYQDLFCRMPKVTPKKIKEYLITNGFMQKDDVMGGLDETVKSSLKPLYEFRNLLEKKILTEADVDDIVRRSTYTEDKRRFKQWLKKTYPQLNDEDYKYISRLKYKDFGRLSGYFLNGIEGANKETGEVGTIMHFLWESNDNLMQILSDRYTFVEEINDRRRAYYQEQSLTLNEQMEKLGISNAVKRPVTRTLAVVKDVTSTLGYAPKKIFVEMARGEDEKKQRTVTRKDQILELYKLCGEDTVELEKQLEAMGDTANNQLQSEALFLYYMQLGKCMYSGKPIDISQLKTTKYNIDHIYPQSLVKDDSVLNNKVLVLSEINGDKKDVYPIDKTIREKMHNYWTVLKEKGLITKEKYARLIRSTPFSESEKLGFIHRQLVETRQSMKAVTQLLNYIYPDTEIVYVKARLAGDFRQVFDLAPKSRIINDLHHAKDAYLNIVVGNVYHERFTKKWFNVNEKYSVNPKALFTHDVVRGKDVIWDSKADLDVVKTTYAKNNIHLTKYAYCPKGGLFDQMPVKKGEGLTPLKQGMDTTKYGGYNKASASFFVIARYLKGNKKEVSFIPVELMVSENFLEDDDFAIEYVQKFLEERNSKAIESVEFPIGKRVIKYKTVLSLDGYRVWINGKANKGAIVSLTSAESSVYSGETVAYIKHLESYVEKKKVNKNLLHDDAYDGLSEEQNIALYDTLTEKLGNHHFMKMPGNQYDVLQKGRDKFMALDFDDQTKALMSCIDLLKSGRAGTCDLSLIGGKGKSGAIYIGANISSAKYSDIRIIDRSPSGIHEKVSMNLKDLLQ